LKAAPALVAAGLALAGCAETSLDLSRAGRALRGHPPPPAPVVTAPDSNAASMVTGLKVEPGG